MSKFNKGDLVEITGSDSGRQDVLGIRFVLQEYKKFLSTTTEEPMYAWRTPIDGHAAKEVYLKKVNPDCDEITDLTFYQLLSSIKGNSLKGVNL